MHIQSYILLIPLYYIFYRRPFSLIYKDMIDYFDLIDKNMLTLSTIYCFAVQISWNTHCINMHVQHFRWIYVVEYFIKDQL